MYIYVRECLLCKSVCVCTCMWRKVCFVWKGGHRGGPRSAVCRLPSLRGGWVGVWGHVGPVCGNPALLTSHTLFSCSYKPLMPQKMLSLLWPGTAEGGGQWGGGRRREEGSEPSLSLVWLPWLPPLLSSPLFSSPVLFRLCSPVLSSSLLSSSLFTQLCHLAPLKRIWPGRI